MSETRYSSVIKGNKQNFNQVAKFDKNAEGFLGISQFQLSKDGQVRSPIERVLLTPEQVSELIKFYQKKLSSEQ